MATKRQRGQSWEYIVKRKALLARPLTMTFDSEAEGDAYVARLEQMLDAGIVPPEFQEDNDTPKTIASAVKLYVRSQAIAEDDHHVLGVVIERIGMKKLTVFDYDAAEVWILQMKRIHKLAPGTIRKHVGALARALDWAVRKNFMVSHPLRNLPRGYSTYTEDDGEIRKDESRDRRFEAGEEDEVRRILAGGKPTDRERGPDLEQPEAMRLLFELGLETAMRLSEMHTLDYSQVDLPGRAILLDRTKNGDKRQVPLSTVAVAALQAYGMKSAGPLFPWAGTRKHVTALLSGRFVRIFAAAGCKGFTFHCLRHEATSRLFERTQLSDIEIASITGHKDLKVLKRYTHLRASKLAAKLW